MAYHYNYSGGSNGGDSGELISWIIVVGALMIFWPVGLILLFRKLTMGSANSQRGQGWRSSRDGTGKWTASAPGAAQGAQTGQTAQGTQSAQTGQTAQGTQGAQATRTAQGTQTTQSAQTAQGGGYTYKYDYRYRSPSGQTGTAKQPGMQGVRDQGGRKGKKKVDLKKGKGMSIWGGILAGVFGFISAISFPSMLIEEGLLLALVNVAPLLGFTGLGLVLLVCGAQRNKKAKRLRRYLALIGKRDSISIATLAQAMGVSVHAACDDLQEMLDEGYIPAGYLDLGSGRLILSDEGLQEEQPPEEEETEESEEDKGRSEEDDNAILQEIRQVNESIADPVMSAKIDRIGEITGKILDYQRKNPSKNSQLRSFLSYYLPTTLKILKAYAQMEAQGVEGENIRSAKARIEGMMDKVVEGFEKQLDKLFQDDAMDITTDVEVLERMLDKDGLSDGGITLGGV